MPVVNVRKMRVLVGHRLVLVVMHMRLAPIPIEIVRMLVMLVVHMGMAVLHGRVRVFVLMPLREVQPHAQGHEPTGKAESSAHGVAQP